MATEASEGEAATTSPTEDPPGSHPSRRSPPPSSLEHLATLSPSTLAGSPAWSASFSVDGRYLAACFGNPDTHIKVWERIEGTLPPSASTPKGGDGGWKLMAAIWGEHNRTIRSVAFAPTSSTLGVPVLATASFDGKVIIWEHYDDGGTENKKDEVVSGDLHPSEGDDCCFDPIAQLEGHENEVKCLAWNATGSLLASCGRDKTIWMWECFLPGTVGGSETPSGNLMIADPEGDNRGEFECLAVLQGHDGDIKSIAFSPSHSQFGEGEEILLSASYDNTIRVWAEEAGDWYCAATLGGAGGPGHASTVWCLGPAPSGVRLLSGSEDGSLGVWRMHTAAERRRLSPSSSAGPADGLWRRVVSLPDVHSGYAVLSVDCAPSRAGHGGIASGGGDDRICVHREEVGEGTDAGTPSFAVAATADAHEGDVNCVRWHPRDGSCLVSCGDDGAVKLWRYRR